MLIDTYVLAHQEEPMIEYFMRHYSQFSQVYLMEGHSTDKTVEIALKHGAIHYPVDSENTVNDEIWTSLKNNCWKKSKADWVIVCDVDEFVLHPDGISTLLYFLKETKKSIFMPRLWNMFSDTFPTTKGQIYEDVQYGVEGGAKMNIFRPMDIAEINYGVGCHRASPVDKDGRSIKPDTSSPLMTLHMSHLSVEYTIKRRRYLYSRLSEINKKMGWGFHLDCSEEQLREYMKNEMTALIKVL